MNSPNYTFSLFFKKNNSDLAGTAAVCSLHPVSVLLFEEPLAALTHPLLSHLILLPSNFVELWNHGGLVLGGPTAAA